MKAFLISTFFVLYSLLCCSQQIGFSGGYCQNHFHDFHKDEGHLMTDYEEGSGYSFNINLDNVHLDTLLFRFSFNFTKYDGSIMTTDGGLGGSSTTNADVEKYALGLSIFPINIKIFKELRLNFGGEFSYLVNSKVHGTKSAWNMASGGNNIDLEDGSVDIFKEFNFGIISRLGYNIKLLKYWYIVPEYNFYLGLTNEFDNIESNVSSFRHYFMLGVVNRNK